MTSRAPCARVSLPSIRCKRWRGEAKAKHTSRDSGGGGGEDGREGFNLELELDISYGLISYDTSARGTLAAQKCLLLSYLKLSDSCIERISQQDPCGHVCAGGRWWQGL